MCLLICRCICIHSSFLQRVDPKYWSVYMYIYSWASFQTSTSLPQHVITSGTLCRSSLFFSSFWIFLRLFFFPPQFGEEDLKYSHSFTLRRQEPSSPPYSRAINHVTKSSSTLFLQGSINSCYSQSDTSFVSRHWLMMHTLQAHTEECMHHNAIKTSAGRLVNRVLNNHNVLGCQMSYYRLWGDNHSTRRWHNGHVEWCGLLSCKLNIFF